MLSPRSCLVLIVLVAAIGAMGMTVKVDPRTAFCVTETVGNDVPLNFQFQVTAGGKLDIDCDVYDASGARIYGWKMGTRGELKVKDSKDPSFKFCFSNEMAQFTPKWVNFHLIPGTHPEAAAAEHVDPLEEQVNRVSDQMDQVLASQMRLRNAERDHRNTVEDANDRVLMWTVFEALTLLIMGGTQIFFLKRFLEVRATV